MTRIKKTHIQNPIAVKSLLDQVLNAHMHERHLDSDPLGLVHVYDDPQDREVMGFLAALFAFGQVTSMRSFLKRFFFLFGPHPSRHLLSLRPSDFRTLQYRFIHGDDIAALVATVQILVKRFHRLEAAFLASDQQSHLSRLLAFRQLCLSACPRQSRAMNFLFSDPVRSCGKRWHLFLRWMVRRPPVDLGLWSSVSPADLIIPLDTHIFDIARALQLSREKKASVKMALEITETLRQWSPQDPLVYDFALCQLGIQKLKSSWLQSLSQSSMPNPMTL